MKLSTVLTVATSILISVASADPVFSEADSIHSICWKACFNEKPHCPHGWYAKKFGHCWTCCKDTGTAESEFDLFEL
ncbi:hypothetical protein BDV23DRAFT_161175 [Aspergillus alliaceus]|uniref:Uncharacterized protein n=1 Tax=Petromyces alliaceus TaxID=209559 RepID=A0A5N7C072_PETAA|nr:hypothetical protein BDV23DRAFT_161175 [Aspergillus alliaceus]